MDIFKRPLIGVDIGSRTLKAVRLKRRGVRISLDSYFFHDLSDQNDLFPEVSNSSDFLEKSVKAGKLKRSRFATSIPDQEVLHLALELPKMKHDDTRTAVRHELSEHTGISPEELAFDFLETGPVHEAGLVSISAYGTRREVVEKAVSPLTKVSLRPAVVESNAFAISAMLEFNGYIEKEKSYAIFDLGESHLTSSLVIESEVRFSKSAATGFGKINQVLIERFGFSYSVAEVRKLRYDFNNSSHADQEAEKVIDEVYASIFSEVRRSLEFFREYLPEGGGIDQIILVGGGSQAKNLDRVLQLFFKIPVTIANPFRSIDIFKESALGGSRGIHEAAPHMAGAVGLALVGLAGGREKNDFVQ